MLVESNHYGEVFNIGSGKALSLRELLEMIVSLSSQEITVEVDPGFCDQVIPLIFVAMEAR